jgi:hypothetical protein
MPFLRSIVIPHMHHSMLYKVGKKKINLYTSIESEGALFYRRRSVGPYLNGPAPLVDRTD